MKVLVFGSNGLVGSSLKRNLPKEKIFSETNFSTREDTNLFSSEETSNTILEYNPDVIINAAAKVGGIYANNTQRTSFLLENLKININILEASTKLDTIKIINLGSSCIYPLNAPDPIKEEYVMSGKLEPTNSPYAMAKLTALELGNTIRTEFGHEVINLMPTNLYGPSDNFSKVDSHVIPGLIRKMHDAKINKETEFKIWGTGKPLREFLYVDDLAKSIIYILKNKINDELINIGSGEEVSIYDLSKKIKNTLDYNGSLMFDSSMPDGNPRKFLDSNLINSYGWKPEISLDAGLQKTYEWFLNNEPRL
mgnify:CR=1 FL=1